MFPGDVFNFLLLHDMLQESFMLFFCNKFYAEVIINY